MDYRDNLALFLSHFPRRLFDAARVGINHNEKQRRYRERDQGEAPIDIKHNADHAYQSNAIDERAQQSRGDEALDRIDVAGDATD